MCVYPKYFIRKKYQKINLIYIDCFLNFTMQNKQKWVTDPIRLHASNSMGRRKYKKKNNGSINVAARRCLQRSLTQVPSFQAALSSHVLTCSEQKVTEGPGHLLRATGPEVRWGGWDWHRGDLRNILWVSEKIDEWMNQWMNTLVKFSCFLLGQLPNFCHPQSSGWQNEANYTQAWAAVPIKVLM